MSRIPQITGLELIRALQRIGFYVHRKKGSHRFLYHREDRSRLAIVAVHKGETIPPGTLTAILPIGNNNNLYNANNHGRF